MKIGMQSRLYNAEIRNRRLALGLSQNELASKIGYGKGSVTHAETFRIVDAKNPLILKLADFFDVNPEVLCPPWLHMMDGIPTQADSQAEFTKPLLEKAAARRMALPYIQPATQELDMDRETLVHTMKDLLGLLSPFQQQAISLIFGLDGVQDRTLNDVAQILKRTRTCVSASLHAAIRKLKHHRGVVHRLQPFCDSEPDSTRQFSLRRSKRQPKSVIRIVQGDGRVMLPEDPSNQSD